MKNPIGLGVAREGGLYFYKKKWGGGGVHCERSKIQSLKGIEYLPQTQIFFATLWCKPSIV